MFVPTIGPTHEDHSIQHDDIVVTFLSNTIPTFHFNALPSSDEALMSFDTSPKVSFIHEERSNTPINDLSNGEATLKINIEPSSSQEGQDKHVRLVTSIPLDPPYSPIAYLNYQHILR